MHYLNLLPVLIGLSILTPADAPGAPAVFVQQGKLLVVQDNGTSRSVGVRAASAADSSGEGAPAPISNYWGRMADGRMVVTIASNVQHDTLVGEDHHCSVHTPGECAFLVTPDGVVTDEVSSDVLRAYPAPAGQQVAVVTAERDLLLWRDGMATTVTAPGKVSNVGWSPDGRYLVAAVRAADWSEGAVSAAPTTVEFLRLQNSDLYLLDASRLKFVTQLTNDPGSEFAPFFSPDGQSVYYNWAHLLEDEGGLMRLELDHDGGTSASAPAAKLTVAGNDAGEVPLGRVTTYLWAKGGTQLIFESGLSDGFGEVWTMSANGTGASRLATGRKPQLVSEDDVVFIDRQGTPNRVQAGGLR